MIKPKQLKIGDIHLPHDHPFGIEHAHALFLIYKK